MFAPDMTNNTDAGGYPSPGELMDVNAHPAHNLPDPGYSPDMQHSPMMAGDTLPAPGFAPKATLKQATPKSAKAKHGHSR